VSSGAEGAVGWYSWRPRSARRSGLLEFREHLRELLRGEALERREYPFGRPARESQMPEPPIVRRTVARASTRWLRKRLAISGSDLRYRGRSELGAELWPREARRCAISVITAHREGVRNCQESTVENARYTPELRAACCSRD